LIRMYYKNFGIGDSKGVWDLFLWRPLIVLLTSLMMPVLPTYELILTGLHACVTASKTPPIEKKKDKGKTPKTPSPATKSSKRAAITPAATKKTTKRAAPASKAVGSSKKRKQEPAFKVKHFSVWQGPFLV
jgi:hypothetical protein